MSAEGENADATAIATEPQPTLEEAMQNIFTACDTENQGAVPTAKLIEYISPFMAYNRTELMQLQEMLDPQDENVLVSKEKFYEVMNDWAKRINSTAVADESESFLEAVPRDFYKIEEEDCPFVQSTPRSSFGHQFLKGYAVSGISNMSIFSECAATPSDKTVFEEQLKELTHQNRKLTEELTQAKVQLTSSEEYIEALQADLNQAVRKLNSEQQTNEQLQKRVEESDTVKEISGDVMLQYNQLKKEKDLLEKENAKLKANLEVFDDEKHGFLELAQRNEFLKQRAEKRLLQAEKEVELSEEKINELQGVIERLQMDIKELQSAEETYKQSNEELLAENQTLQKLLHKFQIQQTTSGIISSQNTKSPLFSPLEKIRQTCTVFNSPKLVKQLSNPLSPLANTPPEEKPSENTPKCTATAKASSTPNQPDTLLDDSIPADLANVSVLSPQISTQSSSYVIEEAQKTVESVRNNTSEEDYWKVNFTQILDNQSPHNSLHAELSEVINGSCLNGKECVHLIRLEGLNNDYLSLQQELLELKTELEKLQKENADNSNNESVHSNTSTTYVTEVRMHLDQESGDASSIKTTDSHLQKEIQELKLKLEILQQDNDKLTKCNQENQNKCERCMVDLKKMTTLHEELKTEIQAMLAENHTLKEISKRSTNLKEQIDDLHRQYLAERIEWNRQKEELESRVDDFSMEVTVLQQKLEKNEMVDICVGCNFYDDDDVGLGGGRNSKGALSFTKMQMKLDKMQEKIDNLEEVVRNKNKELQLKISEEVMMKIENGDLKQKLSETALERNKFELVLQNTEIEMCVLKTELKRLTEKTIELKEKEMNIINVVHCIYESNIDMVSSLKEAVLYHCVNSPLISILNTWTDSLHNNLHRLDVLVLNLQPEKATFDDVLKLLTEHAKDLKELGLFNKQFSQTFKQFLEEINSRIFVKSSNIIPPESPDSPSLNDVVQGDSEKIERAVFKKEYEDLSTSEVSVDDIENISSDCNILTNLEEITSNRAFPNLSDAILKSLEHTSSNRTDTVSDYKETAEKYIILMTILATDALSIKQRHENQTQLLNESKERFLTDLKTFMIAKKSTQKTLMRDIIRDFYQVCAFAEMSGALQEETRVHKSLEVIESHVSRKLEVKKQQVTRMVTRFHHLQNQKTAKIVHLKNGTKYFGSDFDKSECKWSSLKKFGKEIWRFFCYGAGFLVLLTIFIILGSTFNYPLKNLCWDQLLAHISRKVYCVKECPH